MSQKNNKKQNIYAILATVLPNVLAQLTREYVGLSGEIRCQLALPFAVTRWTKLIVSDNYVVLSIGNVARQNFVYVYDTSSKQPVLKSQFPFEVPSTMTQYQDELFIVNDKQRIQVVGLDGKFKRVIPELKSRGVIQHNGKLLLVGEPRNQGYTMKVFDLKTNTLLPMTIELPCPNCNVRSFSGQLFQIEFNSPRTIHLIDPNTGKSLQGFRIEHPEGWQGPSLRAVLGDEIFIVWWQWKNFNQVNESRNGFLGVHDATSGRLIRRIIHNVSEIAISNHGTAVAIINDQLCFFE